MLDIDPVELAQRFFEETNDGFIIFHPVTQKILDVNPAIRRLTEFRKRELVGSLVGKFLQGASEDDTAALMDACRTTTFFHSREGFFLRTRGDAYLSVNISVSRIHTEKTPLGLVVIRDVSERKQAERLRDGQNRVLQELGCGKSIPEVLDTLIKVIEEQTNGMLCSILRLERGEPDCLKHVAAPNLPAAYTNLIDGLAIGPSAGSCGTAAFTGKQVIVQDIHKDPLWANYVELVVPFGFRACWSQPIMSDGKVLGTFAMYYHEPRKPTSSELQLINEFANLAGIAMVRHAEMTEQDRIREQILQTQKLESLGVLASGIAHDFNNLLVGILGNADLAAAILPEDSPIRPNIELIERSATHAADLCQQLLAYSGESPLAVTAANLTDLVHDMSQLLKVSVSKQVLLEHDFAENLPVMHVDPSQLRQVVMNLITNASDAIGEQNGVVRLMTGEVDADAIDRKPPFYGTIEPNTQYQFLEVSDNGVGMDFPTMERMFEPFYTTRVSGRGLGLASVLGIVQRHGGAIQVRSRLDAGTTVRVFFPCGGDFRKDDSDLPDPLIGERHSGTLLFADDDDLVRETVVRLLEFSEFNVITATDGQMAIEIFESRQVEIDVVLLDMKMPHKNGFETFWAMRAVRPGVPIVMTSGFQDDTALAKILAEPFTAFVRKPFRSHQLIQAIRSVVDASLAATDSK
ncbi:MAG: response regulator [Planctomycetota bacterium]|nr:response regulator [Planctomycetota bacterium]